MVVINPVDSTLVDSPVGGSVGDIACVVNLVVVVASIV